MDIALKIYTTIGFGIHNNELPYLAMGICQSESAKKLTGHFEKETS